jgi:hypothetical protein
MPYAEIFEGFPPELRLPIARLVDALREELGATSADFEELKGVVRDLAEAQRRTELRIEELVQAQQRTGIRLEELAQAQQRTEIRLEELAQAQQRTEIRLEELAQAQQRTEIRLEELAQAQQRTDSHMGELAQAQKRTQDELTLFRQTFTAQIGGLGARWGMQTEEAFRQGIRAILHEVGFTTERFLEYDAEGEVFGSPDQVEFDVVIKNGKVMVIEIKSSLDRGNTYLFDRKVAFYTRKTGRTVGRKLIVTPYADNRAKEVGLRLGVEICTDITALS